MAARELHVDLRECVADTFRSLISRLYIPIAQNTMTATIARKTRNEINVPLLADRV